MWEQEELLFTCFGSDEQKKYLANRESGLAHFFRALRQLSLLFSVLAQLRILGATVMKSAQ